MASDSTLPSPIRFIEEMTMNAAAVQERVLADILSQNSDTEYLTRFGLGSAPDRAAFMSKIPVVTYQDIQSDINRSVSGDKSKILCSQPISELIYSSGTSSGQVKLFPMNHDETERRMNFIGLVTSVANFHFPNPDNGSLYFAFLKAEMKTPSGLVAQMASTSFLKSNAFKRYENMLTSPIEAIICPDTAQSMYTQLLCGLIARCSVVSVGAVFASTIVRTITFFHQNWRDIVADISTGTLNPRITDPTIKARMAEILRPDPALAELIVGECESEDWKGIVTRIWPNVKSLNAVIVNINLT